MKIQGYLYEPTSSERIQATLSREQGRYILFRDDAAVGIDVDIRETSERLAGIPQTLTLGTEQRFVPFEELPLGFLDTANSSVSRWTDWLERFSPIKATILIAVLLLGILGLRAAVPIAADLTVVLIPNRAEAFIGRQAFQEMDALVLSPSQLSESRRASIETAAQALARRGGIDPVPEIHFREAPAIGANAFAFSGGPIVITDDLVNVLGDEDKILAVIAHELGHVVERHGLRQVLRIVGMFVMASLVLGADDSVMEELAAIAVSTTAAGYSRDFERDADAFASRLLNNTGRSANDLASALQTLLEECGEKCQNDGGWLSTHPGIESRIMTLRR